MVGIDLHGQCKTHTGDCGLRTTDYDGQGKKNMDLGINHGLKHKMQTAD